MADAASRGLFNGPVDAKIQGPYDGHDMADYEIDAYSHKLFLTGGVGIASVLPTLTRIALQHVQQRAGDNTDTGELNKARNISIGQTSPESFFSRELHRNLRKTHPMQSHNIALRSLTGCLPVDT